MQVAKERRRLRLVKSADTIRDPIMTKNKKPLIDSDAYYKQVEHYAQQIRGTSDVDEIISILDIVLSETKELHFSDEVCAAREQMQHAERKIELMKGELEQLRELVHTDQMTGAFNRRGLDEIFIREAARADRNEASLCVVLLDLDNFKQINDNYGHQFGDNALMHLVTIAKETLRPSDIIARYGGEEFVVLLPDIGLGEGMLVIRRLQNNLAKKCLPHIENQAIKITFSAGVAVREFGEHQNSAISRADKALYQAKHAGKNRVISTW
ncbi:MAG: GGDEF domain-containing protein [Nitrosomonas sp.]|nr:GGDEF domain-containing protein [Nitrosomonas sp.]MDP1950574.1 GGDEF domain-containing protein [Nitrosomonas sp.]